jgi:hypothetical protein
MPYTQPEVSLAPNRWAELSDAGTESLRSWPPIALVKTPALAKALGISPKTLSTWRQRKCGPCPAPRLGPKPQETYYLVAEVLSWLDHHRTPAWEYEKSWLRKHVDGFETPFGVIDAAMDAGMTASISVWMRRYGPYILDYLRLNWPNSQPRKKPDFRHAARP